MAAVVTAVAVIATKQSSSKFYLLAKKGLSGPFFIATRAALLGLRNQYTTHPALQLQHLFYIVKL
jgi:hypothetical protein